MAQLIDKSALVAEIENWKQHTLKCGYAGQGEYEEGNKQGRLDTCEKILSLINSLEVKEVDLEKELDKEWNKCEPTDEGMGLEIASIEHEQFDNIAKHFFELGMQQ